MVFWSWEDQRSSSASVAWRGWISFLCPLPSPLPFCSVLFRSRLRHPRVRFTKSRKFLNSIVILLEMKYLEIHRWHSILTLLLILMQESYEAIASVRDGLYEPGLGRNMKHTELVFLLRLSLSNFDQLCQQIINRNCSNFTIPDPERTDFDYRGTISSLLPVTPNNGTRPPSVHHIALHCGFG